MPHKVDLCNPTIIVEYECKCCIIFKNNDLRYFLWYKDPLQENATKRTNLLKRQELFIEIFLI